MSQSHSQANPDVGDSQSGSIGVRQKKKRSNAHFERKGDGSVVCMHCSKVLAHGPTLGTSHLNRHIKDACKQINKEAGRCSRRGKEGDFYSFKYDPNLTRDLITMLFIDVKIPFSVIESQFWKLTMKSLRPEYRAVGRQTLRNDVVEVFKTEKGVSLNEFEELDSHVSFTYDIWTSSVSLGYLCLMTHYIDKGFNLHKNIISFDQTSYPHLGHTIAESIKKTIFEWKLEEKVFAITLDNYSANNNAMTFLEYMFWDKPVFEGENMHMRCGAHILKIMVQNGMVVIRETLTKIRELMRYITSSGPRLQTFNRILNAMQLPSKRGLTLDCITRWNSTYDMVVKALKYKDSLLRYENGSAVIVPSLENWNMAVEMKKFLRIFRDATKTFSTFRRPSSHDFLKKFEWVKFCFGIAYGEGTGAYKEKVECVEKSFKKWYQEYESTTGQAITSMSPQVERQNEKQKKLEISFQEFRSQNRRLRQKRSELDNYLEDAVVVELDEEFDILQWWRKNSELYSTLAKMARDFLAVQVSTVASESAFSAVGRLTDHMQSFITPETIEALICSNDWFASIDESFNLDQFRPFMLHS